jgi:acid phosphatase type 7
MPVRSASRICHSTTAPGTGSGSTSGGTITSAADDSWTDASLTFATRPNDVSITDTSIGPVVAGQWVEVDVSLIVVAARAALANLVNLAITSADADGVYYSSRESAFPPELVLVADDVLGTIAAVGDMACESVVAPSAASCRQLFVAARIAADPSITDFLALGDLQYQVGALAEFNTSYSSSYGMLNAKVKPVPGNHEYGTANASGYFDYFGSKAGDPTKGYYSFFSGPWRLLALNTNLSCLVVACQAGSAQEQYVRTILAADQEVGRPCSIAYWHHPRFSSDTSHGNNTDVQGLWSAMADFKVDAVLNGHVHTYERFDPLSGAGGLAAEGVRQFIVGTGGVGHYTNGAPKPGSVVRITDQFGYMRLQLFAHGYTWDFINTTGQILDSGSATCNI